jgi:hypothetical protein
VSEFQVDFRLRSGAGSRAAWTARLHGLRVAAWRSHGPQGVAVCRPRGIGCHAFNFGKGCRYQAGFLFQARSRPVFQSGPAIREISPDCLILKPDNGAGLLHKQPVL